MTAAEFPSHEALESFFVNNEKLDRVTAYFNRFNPIRTMRMEAQEIRHSAILAWLLDPRETHGFGDRFVKTFLAEAFRGRSENGRSIALDISQSDLRDVEVRREWRNIDILILSPDNGWAFIVENKFYSSQREGQLRGYADKVKSIFEPQNKKLNIRGVFLTLLDEDPQDQDYAPIRYRTICGFLPRLVEQAGGNIGQEVAIFLRHYIEIIREATGMSDERNEMIRLARDLYRSHKKVIDFVTQHGAGSDFIIAAESLFGENLGYGNIISFNDFKYMYSSQNSEFFSFVPLSWYNALGSGKYSWPGCENWWAGYPLICWLQIYSSDDAPKGQLRLYAEVGPLANEDRRRLLIEGIKAAAAEAGFSNIRFQEGATRPGKKFSKFLKSNSIDIQDVHDADEIAKAMISLLSRFQPAFEKISTVLPEFLTWRVNEND